MEAETPKEQVPQSSQIMEQTGKIAQERAALKAENDALEAELARFETLRAQRILAGKSENPQKEPVPETPKEYAARIMRGGK